MLNQKQIIMDTVQTVKPLEGALKFRSRGEFFKIAPTDIK